MKPRGTRGRYALPGDRRVASARHPHGHVPAGLPAALRERPRHPLVGLPRHGPPGGGAAGLRGPDRFPAGGPAGGPAPGAAAELPAAQQLRAVGAGHGMRGHQPHPDPHPAPGHRRGGRTPGGGAGHRDPLRPAPAPPGRRTGDGRADGVRGLGGPGGPGAAGGLRLDHGQHRGAGGHRGALRRAPDRRGGRRQRGRPPPPGPPRQPAAAPAPPVVHGGGPGHRVDGRPLPGGQRGLQRDELRGGGPAGAAGGPGLRAGTHRGRGYGPGFRAGTGTGPGSRRLSRRRCPAPRRR